MKIIPEALKLAKLQRTSMTEEQIKRSYERDFTDIVTWGKIHKGSHKILDVGCGIAGWECFLAKDEQIYLLDKTELDKNLYYGYQKKTSFYNSMEVAKKNLMANLHQTQNIFLQEATENNEILFKEEFDLIVSFISCGFHYPIETYLNQMYEKLKDGGVLIIDIRKGTDGLKRIEEKFGYYGTIREEKKYFRIKAIKTVKQTKTQ